MISAATELCIRQGSKIHITADLQDLIQRALKEMSTLPERGAIDTEHVHYQRGWKHALEWVLLIANMKSRPMTCPADGWHRRQR